MSGQHHFSILAVRFSLLARFDTDHTAHPVALDAVNIGPEFGHYNLMDVVGTGITGHTNGQRETFDEFFSSGHNTPYLDAGILILLYPEIPISAN